MLNSVEFHCRKSQVAHLVKLNNKVPISKMNLANKEEINELMANIDDAKNDKIPWKTLVSITRIYSSTLERSNQLNSVLLDELKGYKERENDLKTENQRLKEITRIAQELVQTKKMEDSQNQRVAQNLVKNHDLEQEITLDDDEPLEKLEKDDLEIVDITLDDDNESGQSKFKNAFF